MYGQDGAASSIAPVCRTFRPEYFATVSGTVTTKPGALAPNPAGVRDVTLTATIVLASDGVTPLLVDDGTGNLVSISATAITDGHGRFTVTVHSNLLSDAKYTLRLVPSKADTDPVTLAAVNHAFSYVGSFADSFYLDVFTHAQMRADVAFYDLSSVPLTGFVVWSRTDLVYDQFKFQGCGVPKVSVRVRGDAARRGAVR